MEALFTIGVYGFDADTFFHTLGGAGIDLFLDLRRRRGVRGAEYAFANAGRLTESLASLNIPYRHVLDLAPDNETRQMQYREDDAAGIGKRSRTQLADVYVREYTRRTLDPFDMPALLGEIEAYRRPVLFCVEAEPNACHRHLVAERIEQATGAPVIHLRP